MKYLFLINCCLLSYCQAFACQCQLTTLSINEMVKYDVIFKGKIINVKKNGENSSLFFSIQELYKGMVTEKFKIEFNDNDACKLEMNIGEEWLIYSNYKQINLAYFDFCSRSRKFFKNNKEDFFMVNTGISYDEEMRYLQKNLGLHKCLKNNLDQEDVEHRNIIPTRNQFILVLVGSIIGILFFYWLVNRLLK